MHNCEKLRNEIWEAVEAGEISRDLLLELENCSTCRSELAKAESAMQGFEVLRNVDAPDCSSQVMARITGRSRSTRLSWVYSGGLAALLVIGAVLTALYWPRSARLEKRMARATDHHIAAPHRIARSPIKLEQPRVADAETAPKLIKKQIAAREIARVKPAEPKLPVVSSHKSSAHHKLKTLPLPEPLVKKENDLQQYAGKHVRESEPDDQVIAIVVMDPSVNSAAQDNQTSSYGYSQTDPETGDVTTCSVKRSGDAVEIHMKMEPGNKEIPGEGSLEHEDGNNA